MGDNAMQQELPDFDTLKQLAEHNPEALEILRQQHIDALIESAPENTQHRLRGLQFQIDAQRRIHPTPMAACIKLSQMMHESFSDLRYLLNEFTNQGPGIYSAGQRGADRGTQPAARVLEFHAPC